MSSMFQRLGNKQPTQQEQPQNPKDQAISLMKQQGIAIPQGMENDPNALLQHVLQSGKVPQGRFSMAQQIMRRMFGR